MADTRTIDGIVYAINPSLRPNPSELVVIENPAPRKRKGQKPRADATKRRRSGNKPPRDARGRFITKQSGGQSMATKTRRKTTRTSSTRRSRKPARRRNPAAGALKGATTKYMDAGGVVVGAAAAEIGVGAINARIASPTLKAANSVLTPALVGVAAMNKGKAGFVHNAGLGMVVASATNLVTIIRSQMSGGSGLGHPNRQLATPYTRQAIAERSPIVVEAPQEPEQAEVVAFTG